MPEQEVVKVEAPEFLYKIITKTQWDNSLSVRTVKKSEDDINFIHLATEEQIPKILKKYWIESPEAVILKLDPKKFKGRLKKEKNPGGETEYFHLYGGGIPIEAVVDVAVCSPKQLKL